MKTLEELCSVDESKEVRPALLPVASKELDGMEEFNCRNWISFNPQEGRLECKTLALTFDEIICTIVDSRVVLAKKDKDGNVTCSSADRLVSSEGEDCSLCEDRGINCNPLWWIAFKPVDMDLIFAHTLSITGSTNFTRYANMLKLQELLPSQVTTRIYLETATRKRVNTQYRRLQFERVDLPKELTDGNDR